MPSIDPLIPISLQSNSVRGWERGRPEAIDLCRGPHPRTRAHAPCPQRARDGGRHGSREETDHLRGQGADRGGAQQGRQARDDSQAARQDPADRGGRDPEELDVGAEGQARRSHPEPLCPRATATGGTRAARGATCPAGAARPRGATPRAPTSRPRCAPGTPSRPSAATPALSGS